MLDRHIALIVEDEPEMAAELGDLLRSFGHDHLHAETVADARARLDEGGFCYVLLDLQIKADSQSIKPRVESGMAVLAEIRKRYPHRSTPNMHRMPVIVISGHGKEPRNIITAFQNGIDDFIIKPLSSDGQDVGAMIRRCLELAGRSDHDACEKCTNAAACDLYEGRQRDAVFSYSRDYSQVSLHGQIFRFKGPIQRAAIRFLHAAAQTDEPWQSGKIVLTAAKSKDTNSRLSNLLGHHSAWGVLVLSDERGQYRLRIE